MENNEIINETVENMEHAVEEITSSANKGNGILPFIGGVTAAGAVYGIAKLVKHFAKNGKKEKKNKAHDVEEDDSDVFEKELPEVE